MKKLFRSGIPLFFLGVIISLVSYPIWQFETKENEPVKNYLSGIAFVLLGISTSLSLKSVKEIFSLKFQMFIVGMIFSYCIICLVISSKDQFFYIITIGYVLGIILGFLIKPKSWKKELS